MTSMNEHPEPVGFIGTGSMGTPMVERLLAAGVPVELYARRQEVRKRFAGLGATVRSSIAELARSVRVCIVCVFSADQLAEIALGPDGVLANLPAGGGLVNHTTVDVSVLMRLQAMSDARDVWVLDAPVSGTSEDIRAGQLTVLAGGALEAGGVVEAALRTYASTVVRTGGVGSATKIKLINNLIFAAHVQVAESALRLGRDFGIDPDDLIAAFGSCSADSKVFDYARAGGTSVLRQSIPYLRKDVAAADVAAADLGVDVGTLRRFIELGPLDLTS